MMERQNDGIIDISFVETDGGSSPPRGVCLRFHSLAHNLISTHSDPASKF
jgi:hypothetical protein